MQPAKPRDDLRRDVFISHAGEDKAVARPLADELRARGLKVWFDEYELVLGDSLRRKIGDGLRHARVGLVVLSRSFFAKEWPQWELDGLTARQIAGEQNVIVPVWHGVSVDDVRSYSPPLADLVAARSTDGVQAVADGVERVLARLGAGEQSDVALATVGAALRESRIEAPSVGTPSIAVELDRPSFKTSAAAGSRAELASEARGDNPETTRLRPASVAKESSPGGNEFFIAVFLVVHRRWSDVEVRHGLAVFARGAELHAVARATGSGHSAISVRANVPYVRYRSDTEPVRFAMAVARIIGQVDRVWWRASMGRSSNGLDVHPRLVVSTDGPPGRDWRKLEPASTTGV
jgi:hypothetical protein